MTIRFTGLPTARARAIQGGAADANGQVPERAVASGDGEPCRHCLEMMKPGETYLVLAERPFASINPYAEVGPIFLHAAPCAAFAGAGDRLPPVLEDSPDYIVRGYDGNERIVYGTGQVTARDDIVGYTEALLSRDDIAFVHVRSARNNCWQARVDRT